MNARILVVIVALIAAGFALRALFTGPAPAPDGLDRRTGAAEADGASELDDLDDRGSDARGAADAREAVSSSEVAFESAPVVEDEDDRARIVGRLLLPSGAPAAGAALRVHGWTGGADRAKEFGIPEDWEDVTGEVDADGRFEIAFDAPRAFQFVLDANLAGHAELSWRWTELLPGTTTDVGEQTFAEGCVITGRVVGADGEPTGVLWTVYADSLVGARGEGSDGTRVMGPIDVETGAFRLEGVPPGRCELQAYSRATGMIDGPKCETRVGEPTDVEIVYEGPPIDSTIKISTGCRPFHTHGHVVDGRIVVRGPGGVVHEVGSGADRLSSTTATGLAPGSYTVEIESAIHEPWSQSGVQPGDSVQARLVGSARIALSVVDATTYEPVDGYRVRVRLDDSYARPNEFTVLDHDDERPSDGVIAGLLPLETTVLVDAEGYAPLELPLGRLPGTVPIPVQAELTRGATLAVTVVDSEGEPVEGATIHLYPFHDGYEAGVRPETDEAMVLLQAVERRTVQAETSSSGVTEFEHLPRGRYGLYARWGELVGEVESVEVDDGAETTVAIEFPASGALEGRIVGVEPVDLEELVVHVERGDGEEFWTLRGRQVPPVEVDPQGSFRMEGLLPGEHSFEVRTPTRIIPISSHSAQGTQAQRVALGTVMIRAGATLEETFDLTDRAPGRLVIEATVNGEPAPGLIAELGDTSSRATAGGVLDADGRHEEQLLFPASWDLTLHPLDRTWIHRRSAPIVLEAGADEIVRVEIETSRGRLLVRDAATGQPAAGEVLYLDGRTGVRLDDDGYLDREVLIGTVGISTRRNHSADAVFPVSVVWGPEGPNVEEVSVPFD